MRGNIKHVPCKINIKRVMSSIKLGYVRAHYILINRVFASVCNEEIPKDKGEKEEKKASNDAEIVR